MERKSQILGVDPGSRTTGFAMASFDRGGRLLTLEIGSWEAGRIRDRSAALAALHQQAAEWLERYRPDVAAVEGMFHHRNTRSAFVLAEARGALLAALGSAGIPVVEYSPATVKRTVSGQGGAAKEQVLRAMLRTIAGLDAAALTGKGLDATDALAVAVCHHAHSRLASVSPGRSR